MAYKPTYIPLHYKVLRGRTGVPYELQFSTPNKVSDTVSKKSYKPNAVTSVTLAYFRSRLQISAEISAS
jgi:hypothetical protein